MDEKQLQPVVELIEDDDVVKFGDLVYANGKLDETVNGWSGNSVETMKKIYKNGTYKGVKTTDVHIYRPVANIRAHLPDAKKQDDFDYGGFYVENGWIHYNGDYPAPEDKEAQLDMAIKKHQVIKHELSGDFDAICNNSSSCSFCHVYGTSCNGCPVSEKTGRDDCGGTPWRGVYRTEAEVDAEIEFLESLRDDVKPKPPQPQIKFAIAGTPEAELPGVTVLEFVKSGEQLDIKVVGLNTWVCGIDERTGELLRYIFPGIMFPLDDEDKIKLYGG